MSGLIEFEFLMPDKSVTSQLFPANDPPKLYTEHVLEDGRVGIRIPSIGQKPRVEDVEHVDRQHHIDPYFNDDERCLKGPDGKRAYPRVDSHGRPIWRNKREINEACARMNWSYGDVDGPA